MSSKSPLGQRPSKRPAFQFYFRDWQTDPSLRSCSIAARGLWIDCLAIMAEAVPYGYLAVNGKGILPTVLARRVGESLPDVERLVAELEDNGVFSRTPDGIIFSRRMVRDEHNRQVRAAGGVKSLDNPNVPRPKAHDEGPPEGYPSPPSFRPSPAVASAFAVASKDSTPTPTSVRESLPGPDRDAFDKILSRVSPSSRDAWEAEMQSMIREERASAAQIGRALRDMVANGKAMQPNLRQFRAYVTGVLQEIKSSTPYIGAPASEWSHAEKRYNVWATQRFCGTSHEDYATLTDRAIEDGHVALADREAFLVDTLTVKPRRFNSPKTADAQRNIATVHRLLFPDAKRKAS